MTSKKRVYFRLLIASANAVVVLSDFNNWKQQSLRQQKKGLWTMWITLQLGCYECRIRSTVNGATAPRPRSCPMNLDRRTASS